MTELKSETIGLINNIMGILINNYKNSLIDGIKAGRDDEYVLNQATLYKHAYDAYENFNEVMDELGYIKED